MLSLTKDMGCGAEGGGRSGAAIIKRRSRDGHFVTDKQCRATDLITSFVSLQHNVTAHIRPSFPGK
jgi:hypothetical protein